jgi:hypothetical protein
MASISAFVSERRDPALVAAHQYNHIKQVECDHNDSLVRLVDDSSEEQKTP